MTDAKPYPKSAQLARGTRKYRRKVASAKQWQAIIAAKVGPCRICGDPGANGRMYGQIQLHHIVARDLGGDDVADNIAPLCPECHHRVTRREYAFCYLFVRQLTDAEYAYAVTKLGENVFEHCYGITYRR